jgi:hypothetical protein
MASHDWLGATRRPRWVPRSTALPRWLALREGAAPLIVVAPHGGRRTRPIRRNDAVNDIGTASIAWELAERLDAHAVINQGLDRNLTDLNRTTALAGDAAQVASVLAAAVDYAGSEGRTPLVLFVHGWNMVSPCCDIGAGLRELDGRLFGRNPTLSQAMWDGEIAQLRQALSKRGITASVGRRYPASGVDNAAQIFSGRHRDNENPDVARLSRAAGAGQVDAVQLELGVSLRQPGGLRAAFIDGVIEVLGSFAEREAPQATVARDRDWSLPPIRKGWMNPLGLPPGFGLQACWNDGEAALFCGVEPAGPQAMSARFSLVIPGGPMFLLVGEGPWDGSPGLFSLEGFHWNSRSSSHGKDAWRLRVDTTMIRYPSHDAYLDLESGLAQARVVSAEVDLTFTADDIETGTGNGRLVGTICVDGFDFEVDTAAMADRRGRTSAGGPRVNLRVWDQGRVRTLIAEPVNSEVPKLPANAVFDPKLAAIEAHDVAYRVVSIDGENVAGPEGALATLTFSDRELGHDRSAPAVDVVLHVDDLGSGNAAVGRVTARVPIWRPLGNGLFVRWSFGVVRWNEEGPQGRILAGLFDRIELFRDDESSQSS